LQLSSGWCAEAQPLPWLLAAPGIFTFKSNSTNKTYALNTNPLDQKSAQQVCNNMGGHLVSYATYEEQIEVESYYIKLVSMPSMRAAKQPGAVVDATASSRGIDTCPGLLSGCTRSNDRISFIFPSPSRFLANSCRA
jgi:hypothetical protein